MFRVSLDNLLQDIELTVNARGYEKATVAIDKIDKFVAGEAYNIQRLYIESLLEVEDDFHQTKYIKCKVFVREDLFSRLDFTSLGYDKVQDNTISLKWSKEESLRFIALRIMVALSNAKIASINDILQATDLSDYNLKTLDRFIITYQNKRILSYIIKIIKKYRRNNKTRETSLFSKFDRAIITKIFPRKVFHINQDGCREEICVFEFISTHFLDGNNACTPRYLLIFLKEVRDIVASYFEDNPDEIAQLEFISGDWEWVLFKRECVEKGYASSKEKYLKNISSIDESWRAHILNLIEKKGRKTKFNYKWIRANIDGLSEDTACTFLTFLQVIGFLKISSHHEDIRKREYELPILYKPTPTETNA